MHDNALAQKLDEILRAAKDALSKIDSINRFLSRSTSEPIPPVPTPVPETHIADKYGWLVADKIQAAIGVLLLLTLIYSIQSYNLSRENGKRQLRAYMVVTGVELRIPPHTDSSNTVLQPGVDTFRIMQKNSGQTPANYVHLEFDSDSGISDVGLISTPQKSGSSLTVIGSSEVTFNDLDVRNIDRQTIEDIGKGIGQLRIKGVITYTDTFREAHHTWFCFRWVGDLQKMQACPDHNDFD